MATGKRTKGFSLIHLNARSLLRHIDEIQSEMNGYDIIALTETWLTDKIDDRLLTFCKYSFLRLDRNYVNSFNTTKKGGGILVYFKKELEPYVKDIENNVMTRHSEELWVTFKKPGRKVLTLGIVYRPPSGDVPTFIKSLDHKLSNI